LTPDFLIREPEGAYRAMARDLLTSHQLADFRKCPSLYHKKKLGLIADEDRPAYLVGRAVHAMILEGDDEFYKRYASGGPVNPRTGKPFGSATQAYTDWKEEQAAKGLQCLTAEQHLLVADIAEGVRSHPHVRELLVKGVPEGVVRTEYRGMACQSRIDWFHPEFGILDLKTADSLDYFEADARRYGYAHQLAFYRSVAERVTGVSFPVRMVAVEKRQPFRCGVWLVSEQTLAYCQQENEAAIERLKVCEKSGVWPTGFEEPLVFDAP